MFLGRFGLFRFVYLVLRIHRVIPAYLESLAQGWVPRNLWKCSGKYFEISWVCHLDRLMNEVRGLRPLQRMKTIFKWEFWVDHLVYKVWRGREGWESKEKGEYKHTSCDKSWEHSSHSYYSCLQTYESVWICMKYELNWIESYRIRISHNVPDVSSSSHRPMELKERYAILQCQFTKFSTNLRFGPISTSISSMVLIQLFFESQPSEPRIFEGFFRLFFSCSISSAGPFSGLVKMGLLKEQEIPYLADRAQRLDMKYTQEILSVPFWMDLDLQTRVEEQSKVRLWGIDRRH